MIKSGKMKWEGNVARMGEINGYKMYVEEIKE
jgi:hypothetical protein